MLLPLAVFFALVSPTRPQIYDPEAAALGAVMEVPSENCPTGHNTLWTLTAAAKEMSYTVRDLKTRTTSLEEIQTGLLAMGGAATIAMRNMKADLVMNDDATALSKLKHGPAGHIVLAQGAVAAIYTAMKGDGTLNSAGTLDLAEGAVSLDELDGLGGGEIIVGQDGTAVNNSAVRVSGDAVLARDGVLTIQSARVGLSKLAHSNVPGQLVLGQGPGRPTAYTTITGDAAVSAGGVLTIGPGVVDGGKLASLAVDSDHILPSAVDRYKIKDGAVTSTKLGVASVLTEHLDDNSVTSAKLAPGAISLPVLFTSASPNGAADAGKLLMFDEQGMLTPTSMRLDGSLGPTGMLLLAKDAVTNLKLADGAVSATKLAPGSVGAAAIAAGAVTADKLQLEVLDVQPLAPVADAKKASTLLTLTNVNRGADMVGAAAAIKFRQFYHADIARPADAASIAAGAAADWTADAVTHSSFLAVSIRTAGAEEERLRVGPTSSTVGRPDTVAAAALAHTVKVGGALEPRGGLRLSVAVLNAADVIVLPNWASVVAITRSPGAPAVANVFDLPGGQLGQTLTLMNFDAAPLAHDGLLPDVAPGFAAAYVFLGDRWALIAHQQVHDTLNG